MCCCGISLRTSTYFWTFMHIFLAVVFLLVCGLETFKFHIRENEQGFLFYVSSQIITHKNDLLVIWCYGIVYMISGLILFHGVHKELPRLIKWVLFAYLILQFCSFGLLKMLLMHNLENNKSSSRETHQDLLSTFISMFQINLVVFFLTIQISISFFYAINLLIYSYILQKSKIIMQSIVYV